MLGPVAPTAYDVTFRLFGIPVRIAPWFWVMAVIVGWSEVERGTPFIMLWVLSVLISLLVHEFGHALAASALGYPPKVLLYQFGGLAYYVPTQNYTPWRDLFITAAGPGAGFLLFLIASAVRLVLMFNETVLRPEADMFFNYIIWINLIWTILNLMPVLPLDGGRISQSTLLIITPKNGVRIALIISVIVGGMIAAYAFVSGAFFLGIMFGMMAGSSLNRLQQRQY